MLAMRGPCGGSDDDATGAEDGMGMGLSRSFAMASINTGKISIHHKM